MSKELSSEYKKYTLNERRLLAVLAQQLKVPLVQITKLTEVQTTAGQTDTIHAIAQAATDLVEYYQYALLAQGSTTNLEPVSLSAIFYNSAARLEKLAKLYRCDINIDLSGSFPPVLGSSTELEAVMTSLGSVMIEAQTQQQAAKRGVITLAAHRSRWGLVAGAYSQDARFSSKILRQGKAIYGYSKHPLNQAIASPAAGVFIAEALLHGMSSGLHAARFRKLSGLAATLTPSAQLRLV